MKKNKTLTKEQLEKMKELLLKRRIQLTSNIKTGLEEIENQEGHHLADLEDIGNIQDNDAVFEVVNIASANLDQTDKALDKLKKGTYGVCEDCGSPITLERLKALPFATQCIKCKRKIESER